MPDLTQIGCDEEEKDPEEDKGLLGQLGPGLITGASDDDPSGIGTYSQAGAQLGFGNSWSMLVTYLLMAAIQEISARTGRVTGHGMARNVCRNFPPQVVWSLVFLLFIANTINVAVDLGAMAAVDARFAHYQLAPDTEPFVCLIVSSAHPVSTINFLI